MLAVSCLLGDLGLLTCILWMFDCRDDLFELLDRVSGTRLHSVVVLVDVELYCISMMLCIDLFFSCLNLFLDLFVLLFDDFLIMLRLLFIGYSAYNTALIHCLTGILLRSIGLLVDLRLLSYSVHPIYAIGFFGDCYIRSIVRLLELHAAILLVYSLSAIH